MKPTPYERFADSLHRFYGIKPTAIREAPRGYAAETFYVDAEEGSYFLKIMHTARRQSIFLHGLTVADALAAAGIDYISKVVRRTDGGLSFAEGESVCALFMRLDARQSYHYNREDVFQKLAQIYRVSAGLPERDRFMRETFADGFIGFYEREYKRFKDGSADTPEAAEMRALLESYTAFLDTLPAVAAAAVEGARSEAGQAAFYLTHSDYTGNVMIAEDGTQYLIDFDEAIYGPIERDGFMVIAARGEESELWQSVMAETFPGYRPNDVYIRFYLFERFMVDLASFMDEAASSPDPDHRRKVIDSTRDYLLGYLYPMLRAYL